MSSVLNVVDETELFAALCSRARARDEITMSIIAQDRGDIISFIATNAGLAQIAPTDAAVQAVCALVKAPRVHFSSLVQGSIESAAFSTQSVTKYPSSRRSYRMAIEQL